MSYRRLGLLFACVICIAPLALSQKTDLYVYVSFQDQSPAKYAYKVELLTSTRMRVSTELTNDRGQAIFRGVDARDYRVVVTGPDIDETETSLTVEPRGSSMMNAEQNEHIEVKRKTTATGPGGAVSAATLNIPDKARKEYEKGLDALDHHDIAGAHEHLAKAVEIYPQYSAALLNLGVISMQSGHTDEGMHYFEQATQADPKNAAGFMYLARAYLAKKNYKEAEPLLIKAVAIIPSNPEPLTLLATLQLQQGEFGEAVTNAQRVHTLQPHQAYAIAHYVAAEALMKESQPRQAAEEYRLFIKEAPSSPMAANAKETLKSIEQPK